MDKDLCKQLNHPETKNTANQDLTLWQKIKVLAAVNVFFSSPVICYGAIAIAEKIATGTISKEAQPSLDAVGGPTLLGLLLVNGIIIGLSNEK